MFDFKNSTCTKNFNFKNRLEVFLLFFFKNRLEFSNQEQAEILFNEQNFKYRLEYLLQEKSERFDFKNDWKQIGSFILN